MKFRLFASISVGFYFVIVPTLCDKPSHIGALSQKNVIFGELDGGSSHVNWVLNILDTLAQRGHNATFVAGGGDAKFGAKFDSINTISISDYNKDLRDVLLPLSHNSWVDFIAVGIRFQTLSYANDFVAFKSIFQETNPDVVLCDSFAGPCIDAAISLNLPLIGTQAIATTPDSQAPYVERTFFALRDPTTLTTSFTTRFYNRYLLILRAMVTLWGPIQEYENARRQVDAPPMVDNPFKNSLKLINSAFGFEPARPLGSLVEMIGPILDQNYQPLTPQWAEYLNTHSRIALVAFGQSFTPTHDDVELILTALVDNVEDGVIDGFLWVAVRLDLQRIPESIILPSSGRSYNTTDIVAGRNLHMRFVGWVPQQAILQHQSVSVFLTHGGVGSIHESLLNGVPLVVFPIIGDQPVNARMVEEIGAGKFMDYRMSREEASMILRTVARDSAGEFKKSAKSLGEFVRIRSAHGASKGADLVEEVMVMNKDGLLPHRYEASRQMNYMKATNLDLDMAMVLLVVMVAWTSWQMTIKLKEKFKAGTKLKTS